MIMDARLVSVCVGITQISWKKSGKMRLTFWQYE